AFGEWVERRFAVPSVAPGALAEAQRTGTAPLLLDVRPEAEYRRFSLPASRSCPNGELAARLDALAGRVAVHCAGRTRSLIGAQTLRDLDPALDVVALRDGTQGWQLAGLDRAEAPDAAPVPASPDGGRSAAQGLIARFALPVIDTAEAARLAAEAGRTAYFLDVSGSAPPAGFRTVDATTLIQQTDRFIAVQGARVMLHDPSMARAAFAAHWLQRMGHEALILDDAPPDLPATPAPAIAAPAALEPAALGGVEAALLDLRPGAEHAVRPAGARWTIRPRVVADAQAERVVLIGDDVATGLAAIDLAEAGIAVLGRLTGDAADWARAGMAVARDADPAPRLDAELFCPGRHRGDLADAAAYLAWEHGLLDRLAAAGIDPGWRA
ncbi:MAG: rhodanese-like domain-containing protein, partial [Pseudomonadota bacterium]